MPRLHYLPSVPNETLTLSARTTLLPRQRQALYLFGCSLLVLLLVGRISLLIAMIAVLLTIFLVSALWRLLAAVLAMRQATPSLAERETAREVIRDNLPSITVMVPVYREGPAILKRLADNLGRLDYAEDRLQILILLDDDQQSTIAAAMQTMPDHFDLLAIQAVQPRTKPRVLNDALRFATGEYVVVWDVEDEPDPAQLLDAMVVLEETKHSDPSVLGVQGKLAFDLRLGHRANLLMRWQAASYNLQFEGFLPALDRLRLPVPLGGTSNVFRTQLLREIGGWDAWNVTEDMDLGVRLARHGYRMRVIDSTTWEEPNPRLGNCLRQWSRWKKGAMQTYLVHMRQPGQLWMDLGPVGFVSFQLTIGLPIAILLLNPLFVLMTGVYAIYQPAWITAMFPGVSLYIGNLCLFGANFLFLFATATASLRRGQYGLVPAAFLSIAHWLLMSCAAYMALWQLVSHRAHFWEATTHGLLLPDQPRGFPLELNPTLEHSD